MESDEAKSAHHEAGHAIMACLLGGRIECASIERDSLNRPNQAGYVTVEWPRSKAVRHVQNSDWAAEQIHVILAGPVAEAIYLGKLLHPAAVPEWQPDWNNALATSAQCQPNESKRWQVLEQIYVNLYKLLRKDDHWQAISELADQLLAHETVDGETVQEIVDRWIDY